MKCYLPPLASSKIHIANPSRCQENSEMKGCQSMKGTSSQRISSTRNLQFVESILQLINLFLAMNTISIQIGIAFETP